MKKLGLSRTIAILEDHDEALDVWRRGRFKNLDLVHLDAHIDFKFHRARPIEQVFAQAQSMREIKNNLESSLAFIRYKKSFDKQTNIGNYIYPAMSEGIVRNFYWVVPGGAKEFKATLEGIKNTVRTVGGKRSYPPGISKEGAIAFEIFGRTCIVCVLEKLPVMRHPVLLDIDTDFMVIDSVAKANATDDIGRRRPWIRPEELADMVKSRIRNPRAVTIAYSVNGGYTPIRYKLLGDELAFCLSPDKFRTRYRRKSRAAVFFERFVASGRKQWYQRAAGIDPGYRAADNNYGPLYLSLRMFSKAKKEFLRVFSADPGNPFCLCGLGKVALEQGEIERAKTLFLRALKGSRNKFFAKAKEQGLLGLAQAELKSKDFKAAKRLLLFHKDIDPLSPWSYYLLAKIYEKERNFGKAQQSYKDALCLGFNTAGILKRLLAVSSHTKSDVRAFVIGKYNELKKRPGIKSGEIMFLEKKLGLKEERDNEESSGVTQK